jgi:sulfur carrier protein ThiS
MTSLNNESIATTVDTSILERARWMMEKLEVG